MTPPPHASRGPRRALHLGLAAVTFGLAVVGVVLPLVPTTPFLLLTSFFLVRSSPALNERLVRSRMFGPFLRDWEAHRGVRLHVKVTAIAMMLLAVGASIVFGALSTAATIVLAGLAIVGLVVVLRLPLIRD